MGLVPKYFENKGSVFKIFGNKYPLLRARWRPESAAGEQSTTDAYVQADLTRVSPQIAGRVGKVLVEENQAVRAGEPLVEIDDRDARIQVEEARTA